MLESVIQMQKMVSVKEPFETSISKISSGTEEGFPQTNPGTQTKGHPPSKCQRIERVQVLPVTLVPGLGE